MMDFETRIKALTRLAESKTDAAEKALRKEFDIASATLATDSRYDALEQSIEIINAIGYRFSSPATNALTDFAKGIGQRQLTYSDQDQAFGASIQKYRNSSTLVEKAIEAIRQFRYLETRKVFRTLVHFSVHADERVKTKAIEGLRQLSGYNITVFYGDEQRGGIGAAPQIELLEECRAFPDPDVVTYFVALLTALNGVLSPGMESASWSYKAVTLSRGATPATATVCEVRWQSIELLIRIYGVVTAIDQKLQVIGALHGATRMERGARRDDEETAMFVRDALRVLSFFAELVSAEDLQIVQQIEHDSYWIFYGAIADEVKAAALRVRDGIAERSEYAIYRNLIGFEGIFGDWETADRDDRHASDEARREAARGYAEAIGDHNYPEWRARIIEYAKTKSEDLATFPVFYYFLERFAVARPPLAFRLLTEDTAEIEGFLIPLLRGLWSGSDRERVRTLIETWMTEGRNLYVSIKMFLSNPDLDVPFARRLLTRATEIGDLRAVRETVAVAVSNYSNGRQGLIEELMLPAIKLLSARSSSSWIFDNWFRKELRLMLADLAPPSFDVVLGNLAHLQKLDYHAEEVLAIIADRAPNKVLTYLCERLSRKVDRTDPAMESFERMPYALHKLDKPLAKIPALAVHTLRQVYDENNYSRFIDGGARLLAKIFPSFSDEFEAELLRVVTEGGTANLLFVAAILRNYQGEPFVHRLAREIVKSSPGDTDLRTEVAVALESTGMVSGEFGMSDAYERKRQEVLHWLDDPDQGVQDFARWYISGLEQMRDGERKRAEEQIALRKHRYGED